MYPSPWKLGFLFLRSHQREEVPVCERCWSACNSGEPATKADPIVHYRTRCARSTEQGYFSGAVAFCSYFPAVGGHSHEAMPLQRVEVASSLAPWPWGRGAHQGHISLCDLQKATPSSEKPCLGVSNWAPKVNGIFWPSLLCASFPRLYSGADVSSSHKKVKCVR